MDDTHRDDVFKTINENQPTWLKTIMMNPDCPKDFAESGITHWNNNSKDDKSSQGYVSYLSSSAGSYDSIMENEGGAYDEAPPQHSQTPYPYPNSAGHTLPPEINRTHRHHLEEHAPMSPKLRHRQLHKAKR
jgi:hypothetical protein